MPRIAAILLYPVEGCRAVRVKSCVLSARGLDGDRRWKVVPADGIPMAPEAGRTLAGVWVEQKGSELWVSAAGMDRLSLDDAAIASASAWFTKLLGTPVSCVHLGADESSGPLLATTTASLAALNQTLEKSVTVDAFRPNFVLEGADPFAEESWGAVKVGGVRCTVAPNAHTLRATFGITLTPELSGAAAVQLRAGQGLDVTAREAK
jgi:uncharacterized protein